MGERYVIVTPAYNEAGSIANVIESVLRQTVSPTRWVIVDNDSTDETPAIVQAYARKHAFLRYLHFPRPGQNSYFTNSVDATMAGVQALDGMDYEYLAMLDADIILPDDYYEQILSRLRANPRLGVASGVYENLVGGRLQKVLHDRRSTPKAIQVFRRQCFEQIHGYLPLKHGGEDVCACVMARMNGWTTWSFPDVKVVHQHPPGGRHARSLREARFLQGLCEYYLCTHPLFMVAKSLRRCLLESPLILGGMLRLAGYVHGWWRGEPRQVPEEVARYARHEQIDRVFHLNRIPQSHRVRAETA